MKRIVITACACLMMGLVLMGAGKKSNVMTKSKGVYIVKAATRTWRIVK